MNPSGNGQDPETESSPSPTTGVVTIRDVADAAGVSISTASYALAATPRKPVKAETAARVRVAAEMLGYAANSAARALRTRRCNAIGMVGDEVDSDWAAGEVIRGAQHGAQRVGAVLMLNTGTGGELTVGQAAADLRGRVDGLVYASAVHRAIELPPAALDLPVVLVNAEASSANASSVVPDEEAAGWEAADVLIRAGHQRLLLLNSMGWTIASERRSSGFRQRSLEAGRAVGDVIELKVAATTPQAALAATYPLLGEHERPTAICCFNDIMSLGVYRAAAMSGLAVPQDLSVIAFGDTGDFPTVALPELTTIQLPDYELGLLAIEELERLRQDPAAIREQRITPRVALRASVESRHPAA